MCKSLIKRTESNLKPSCNSTLKHVFTAMHYVFEVIIYIGSSIQYVNTLKWSNNKRIAQWDFKPSCYILFTIQYELLQHCSAFFKVLTLFNNIKASSLKTYRNALNAGGKWEVALCCKFSFFSYLRNLVADLRGVYSLTRKDFVWAAVVGLKTKT